jgi:hypothetical protein
MRFLRELIEWGSLRELIEWGSFSFFTVENGIEWNALPHTDKEILWKNDSKQ